MAVCITLITACWAALILFWIVSSFGVKHDVNRSTWQKFAWLRIVVALTLLTVFWNKTWIGTVVRQRGFGQNIQTNTPLAVAGVVLCVLGIALAIWARVYLGRNWSPAPAVKEDHELVTSGPYRFVRHPIYTGIMMAMLGTGLVVPLWLLIFLLTSVMFVWRVKVEEALMTKQFPDQYPEYKKRTWALIPWVW